MMLTGWKAIMDFTGIEMRTLKELHETEEFPLTTVGNKVCSSKKAIKEWIYKRTSTKPLSRVRDIPLDIP